MAEKEYIEREAAIAMIRENGVFGSGWSDQEREDNVVDMIESIPAADVRSVVLCKDCKHWEYDAIFRDGWCRGRHQGNPNWYCADGEKREES